MTAVRGIDERLVRLLGGSQLADLRSRLRRRYEFGPSDGNIDAIHVNNLTEAERIALASLVGRKGGSAKSIVLSIAEVDGILAEAGVAKSLRNALEALDGPIIHRQTEVARVQNLWDAVRNSCKREDLRRHLEPPLNFGLVKRLSADRPAVAMSILRNVEAVLDRLPAAGMPRAQLAADVFGDAHALDAGEAAATLILSLLRTTSTDDTGGERERDRYTWARHGVLVNELARPALFMNIARSGAPPSWGEPEYVSLRYLARTKPSWDVAGKRVFVCENPNLLAILADRLGKECPPTVCVEGHLGAAQRTMLEQIKACGGALAYHGDYDWAGIRIGNHVVLNHEAKAWRFSAADYSAAASARNIGVRLSGRPVEAIWDLALTPAMTKCGIIIPEEALADALIESFASF